MTYVIRTALVLIAVAAIVIGVAAAITFILDGVTTSNSFFISAVSEVSYYLAWGRRCLNCVMGNSSVVTFGLYASILLPVTFFFTSIVARVFRLFLGW